MRARHIFGIIIIIAIMVGITIFSAQTATESGGLSRGIVKKVVVGLDIMTKDEANSTHYAVIEAWDHRLRKATHFTIYFILAFVTYLVLFTIVRRKGVSFVLAWLIATVFAIFDEYHQTFVDGRGGQFSDVVLDSMGAFTAVVLGTIIIKIKMKRTP